MLFPIAIFGVGDEGVKIVIGSVIVDDAHACTAKALHNINQQMKPNTHLFQYDICLELSDDGHVTYCGREQNVFNWRRQFLSNSTKI